MALLQALLGQWPAMFALVTSFATILIMWVNHHNMFTQIRRVDTRLMFLNGLLLFFIVLTPFTTLLVANHLSLNQTGDGRTAAALYSMDFLLLATVWTFIWSHSTRNGLISSPTFRWTAFSFRTLVGPVSYATALGLSLISGLASIVVIILVAGYFTVSARQWKVDM